MCLSSVKEQIGILDSEVCMAPVAPRFFYWGEKSHGPLEHRLLHFDATSHSLNLAIPPLWDRVKKQSVPRLDGSQFMVLGSPVIFVKFTTLN